MADLNFITDPASIPVPREQVSIRSVSATPYPDGRRIRVEIEITPFSPSDRPNLEIAVHDPSGAEVGSLTVIETIQPTLGVTLHIKGADAPQGCYTLQASLYYEQGQIQHNLSLGFMLPDGSPCNTTA
jgi:hypothetical protein